MSNMFPGLALPTGLEIETGDFTDAERKEYAERAKLISGHQADTALALLGGNAEARGRFAAQAAASAAPVRSAAKPAAAANGASSLDEKTAMEMAELLSSAMRDKLSSNANRASKLFSDENLLETNVLYSFHWKGGDANAPGAAKMEMQALDTAFGGIDAKKNIYVHSATIAHTFSTWQTPLAFDISGLEGKDVAANLFKAGGQAHTWVIWPGSHAVNKRVHNISIVGDDMLKALAEHGQVSSYEEVRKHMAVLPGTDLALVRTTSRFGRILKNNEEWLTDAVEGLQPIAPNIPFYQLSATDAADVIRRYNNEVVGKLPNTKLESVKASISRLDHSAAESKPFASTAAAAGFTPSMAQTHGSDKMHHSAYVVVTYKLLRPESMTADDEQ